MSSFRDSLHKAPQNELEKLTPQKQVERLDYLIKLVKAVGLVDDPEVKLIARSSEHLSSLLDLGGSYAVLQSTDSNSGSSDASFLTLVAQSNLSAASDELERVIRGALDRSFTYDREQIIIRTGSGQLQLGTDGRPRNNGFRSQIVFNHNDADSSNDRFPIAYQIRRADGTIELPVPGDTYFTFYLERSSGANLSPGEVALYPGDVLLSPSAANDPFGSDRLGRLTNENYAATEKVFNAMRLAPYIAESQVREQITDLVQTLTRHPLIAAATATVVGGVIAAQFFPPVGVILDVGFILLGGVQAGFSFASFLYKAATAESQTQLWDASRDLVDFFTTLATTIPFGGLLQFQPANAILNTLRFLDRAEELLQAAGRARQASSLPEAFAIVLRGLENADTAVGRLLQYSSDAVAEFLSRGFDKFARGLPTIEGLRDFADRFQRVSEVAERLALSGNADVSVLLSAHANLVEKVLEAGVAGVDELARLLRLDRLPLTADRMTPQLLVSLLDREGMSIETLTSLLASRQDMTPVLLQRLLDEFGMSVEEVGRIYNGATWEVSLGFNQAGFLLRTFAERIGAPFFEQWADYVRLAEMADDPGVLGDVILDNMRRADRIHFNLNGFDVQNYQRYLGRRNAAGGSGERLTYLETDSGNITNWEYDRIINNNDLLNRTTFYNSQGEVVPHSQLYRPN